MELVVAVLHADGGRIGAVGIALAANQTQLAQIANIHLAEGTAAVGAKMLVPFGILDAVFTAAAAFGCRIVHTAEYAKTAIVAQVNAVLKQAFLALLADDAAFFTVIVSKFTLCIRTVAVAALLAVHIFHFPASLAEAATVAQTAHTVSTEPTVTAQFLF